MRSVQAAVDEVVGKLMEQVNMLKEKVTGPAIKQE